MAKHNKETSDKVRLLLSIMDYDKTYTAKHLSELTGISGNDLAGALYKMKSHGCIKRVAKDPQGIGTWVLVKKFL